MERKHLIITTALPQNVCRQHSNEVRTSAASDPFPFSSSTGTVWRTGKKTVAESTQQHDAPACSSIPPACSGSGDTDARQQLLPDPAAKPNPTEPAMAAYGFLCSLQQVFENNIGCMLSACRGRSRSKAKSNPENAHDTGMQQFMLLSCPGDPAQRLVPMSLRGMPALLTTPFSACKPGPRAPPAGIIQAEMLLHYKCAGLKQPGIATWALGACPKHRPIEPALKSCQVLMCWLHIEGDLHVDIHSWVQRACCSQSR